MSLIVSFDLGQYTGICLSKYDHNSISILSTQTIHIDPFKYFNEHTIMSFSKKCINTIIFEHIITKFIYDLLNKNTNVFFAVEDIFFQKNRIGAYSSLLLYLNKLEEILIKQNCNNCVYKLYRIAPRNIKKIFSNNSLSSKDNMKLILIREHKKYNISLNNIDEKTEHEIDAIAVGITFVENYLK